MNKNSIKSGLDSIAKQDKELKKALRQFGYPKARIRPAGLTTFVNIIVSQQLSTKAADAIMQRIHTLLPDINATTILKCPKKSLRNAGLSERKVEYLKGLAKAIKSGTFEPDDLRKQDDATAIESISSLYGFGIWSAEIYLMFCLRRKDIFPANDLALQVALQKLKQLDTRPTPKQARELVAHWAPYRSCGSLFLWHYYQGAPT